MRKGREARIRLKMCSDWMERLWQMMGKGTLYKGGGGQYEGGWLKSLRHGQGKETWGNKVGIKYVCPIGLAHPGRGFCSYQVSWQ